MTQQQLTVNPDALYETFGKDLYRITENGTSSQNPVNSMNVDLNANNSQNVTVSASDFGSGVDTSTTIQTTGSMQAGKKTYDNTVSGYILGVDPKVGVAKFYIGNTTSYMNWDGTTLTILGTLTATAGTIGGFSIGADYIRDAANSMGLASTVTGSDDVRFWAGDTFANRATAPFRVTEAGAVTGSNLTITGGSITIGSNATIDSSGNATFIGVSSLNKKAYTNFESSGRFISTLVSSGTNTFGNQGVTIACGAVATSSARLLWDISNVHTNNPTFVCTIYVFSVGSGDSRGFVGMGLPTVDGSGIIYSGKSQIGFRVDKSSGVMTIKSETNDGGAGTSQGASLTTVVDNDVIELFIKATATSVKWYYRKNGGTLTLGDTQTTHIPTASSEQYITFAMSNIGSANNCQIIMQNAAYEH